MLFSDQKVDDLKTTPIGVTMHACMHAPPHFNSAVASSNFRPGSMPYLKVITIYNHDHFISSSYSYIGCR